MSQALQVPEISQDELSGFVSSHFSDDAVKQFATQFWHGDMTRRAAAPEEADETAEDDVYQDEDDDGLGYYPDGVKRSLTDEQIAMFRHSELHALERAAAERRERRTGDQDLSSGDNATGKKRKIKGKGKQPPAKKPVKEDLRKRTWDVVEKGLDSLDYG